MDKRKQILTKTAVFLILVIPLLFGVSCKKNQEVKNQDYLYETISPYDASELIEKNMGNTRFIIIDLRTPAEFSTGFIEGAVNIDYYLSDFRTEIDKLDKKKEYLIYCRSGSRSGAALDIMKELFFETVYNLRGGINAWITDGYSIEQQNG